MRQIIFGILISGLTVTSSAYAQRTFWGFDDNNQTTQIPIQCDGQFDETHGGVFMPTPDELFDQGETFLLEKGAERSKAGYCLLSAAIQGNVKAQYRVAQLYNKGLVLPQNDIAAYRWAFLASLKGSKEAEQLALTLEQLLSAEEIQLATKTIEPMLPALKQEKDTSLQQQEEILAEKKAELEEINKEIDELLDIQFVAPKIKTISEIKAEANKRLSQQATDTNVEQAKADSSSAPKKVLRRNKRSSTQTAGQDAGNIFTEKDRMK